MTTLHVRVALVAHATHPLLAMLFIGDDPVSDTVNHRDMRAVRSYYNGVLSGIALTRRDYREPMTFDVRGSWPYRTVSALVPVNLDYILADGIDPMQD